MSGGNAGALRQRTKTAAALITAATKGAAKRASITGSGVAAVATAFFRAKSRFQATIDSASGLPPGGYHGKKGRSAAHGERPWRNRAFLLVDHHFSAQRSRWTAPPPCTLRCCFGTTACKACECAPRVALPMLSPVWHNGSQLLVRVEKVPMAGAKGGFLAKFFR